MRKNKLLVIAFSRMKLIFKRRFGIPMSILVVILLSGLSYSVIALWGCAQREIKNIDSRGKNIICFGDSITFGYGVSSGEDYPSVLAGIMRLPIINAGIDGDTTTEAIKRLNSDVLAREPLLVIIEFGGNDFLRKIPQEITINNIKEMVQKVQKKGAIVAIVDVSISILLEGYHSALHNLAQKEGAIFIPNIFNGIITNPHLKSDFLHPNSDGYKIIAQRIYRAVIPYINQNTLMKRSKR